jgi:hypothetical protein
MVPDLISQMQSLLALVLTLVIFPGGGWQEADARTAAAQAAQILGQCGIAPVTVELQRADVAARFRVFYTPVSRELARRLQPKRPTVYFVDATRENPPFDAEAIGRGNSRSRPELADSVWIVRDARDPGIALAHELAHVLMDSGEHNDARGNLMRDETTPGNTALTPLQCERLRRSGAANGLLKGEP